MMRGFVVFALFIPLTLVACILIFFYIVQPSAAAHVINPTPTGIPTAVAHKGKQSVSSSNSSVVSYITKLGSNIYAFINSTMPTLLSLFNSGLSGFIVYWFTCRDQIKKKRSEDADNKFDACLHSYRVRLQRELQQIIAPIMEQISHELKMGILEEVFLGRGADQSLERSKPIKHLLEPIRGLYDPVQQILHFELEERSRSKKLQEFIKINGDGGKLEPTIYNLSGGLGRIKTLFLKVVALKAAENGIDIPIYINLKDFVSKELDDNCGLLEFIVCKLEEDYGFPKGKTRSRIEQKIEDGKILLLLDGSDEMPENKEKSLCERIIKENIDDLEGLFTNCSAIITTQEKIDYTPCDKLIIEDLTLEDMLTLVKKRMDKCTDDDKTLKESMLALESMLENSLRLCAFASSPLALLYIMKMYPLELSLPRDRAKLYQGYVDALFHTSSQENRHINHSNLPPIRKHVPIAKEQILHLLGHLAWKLHSEHQCSFSKDDILRCIEECLALPCFNDEPIEKEQAFRELKNGLFRKHYEEKYGFSSMILQEHFAALYMVDHRQNSLLDNLCQHRNSLWWEEIILLYIQSAGEHAPQFVKDLAGLSTRGTGLPSFFSDEYAGLLLAAKGLVTVSSQQGQQVAQTGQGTTHLQEVYDKIHIQLYGLLTSSDLGSPTPLFVQQQIASILWEEGIRDMSKDDIGQLLELASALGGYDALIEDLRTIHGHLSNMNKTVPPLLLPLLKGDKNEVEELRFDFESMTDEDLREMLVDDSIASFMRNRIIYALCIQGRRSFSSKMYEILKNEDVHLEVRKCVASALGVLGDYGLVCKLLKEETTLEECIQWNLINALGTFRMRGYSEVVAQLAEYSKTKTMKNNYHYLCSFQNLQNELNS